MRYGTGIALNSQAQNQTLHSEMQGKRQSNYVTVKAHFLVKVNMHALLEYYSRIFKEYKEWTGQACYDISLSPVYHAINHLDRQTKIVC